VVRIASYNVHGCVGLDGRLSPARIARAVAALDADVVCLQELDVGRERSGGVDQAALIAHDLEMLLAFHPTIAVEEERFGDAILSRLPMRVCRADALPRLPGWPGLEPRGGIWVEVELEGLALQVVNTHLSLHPREGRLQARALAGADWLSHPDCRRPRVLCGDLNAFARSGTCRELAAVLRDCEAEREAGARKTWASGLPLWRIDHVFVETTARVRRVEVPATALTRVASDHLPLVAEIELPPA
jgi:endonuclease/exonuclease/phosphatase family metal-dependent hydrolase